MATTSRHLAFLALFLALTLCDTVSAQDGDLVFVQVLHRHGARTPIRPNPASASRWTLDPGQLTGVGIAMLKAFGSFLKTTYVDSNFLPSVWNRDDVYIRSTDYDRTLMSVDSLLSTLYPSQIVPVHTVPREEDTLLEALPTCPSYTIQIPHVWKALDANASATYSSLISTLNTQLRWNGTLSPALLLATAYDNMMAQITQGLPVNSVVTAHASELRAFSKLVVYGLYHQNVQDLRGPIGGGLVRQTLANLQQSGEKASKLVIYSAHDSTVSTMFTGLGSAMLTPTSDHNLPPFGSSIVFELRRKTDSKLYVNAKYGWPVPRTNRTTNNTADPAYWEYQQHPLNLTCPSETVQCSLSAFQSFVELFDPAPAAGANAECCAPPAGFASECPSATAFSDLSRGCQAYRTFCPGASCSQGEVLDQASKGCVALASSHSGSGSGNGVSSDWRAAAIVIALVWLVSVVLGVYFIRKARRDLQTERQINQTQALLDIDGI